MVDARTIAFYDSAADRYDNLTKSGAPDADLLAFMGLLPEGAHVLDDRGARANDFDHGLGGRGGEVVDAL